MRRQIVLPLILMVAMIFTITACGSESGSEKPVSKDVAMDLEDIAESIPDEDVKNTDSSDKMETEAGIETEPKKPDVQDEKESDSENHEEEQTEQLSAEPIKEPSKEQTEKQTSTAQPTAESQEQAAEQTNEQATEQTKEQTRESEAQSAPKATLNGKISSVGSGEFVIGKANAISSEVMVSDGADAEKVTVVYTDNTEFVLCTSSDGGITAAYAVASSADLTSEKLVEIQGAYEGNRFMAQKVTIYNFN